MEKKVEQMREYLNLKKLQENDKSDELIEEAYNNITTKEDKKMDER